MKLISVYSVSPTIVGLRFETGTIQSEGQLIDYVAKASDRITPNGTILRNGEAYGILVEPPTGGRQVATFDSYKPSTQEQLFDGDAKWLNQLGSNRIAAKGEGSSQPEAVFLKSKVIDTAKVETFRDEFVSQHDVFIELGEPLETGSTYRIETANGPLDQISFTYDPADTRSEAVHVNQIGFEPGDPVKAGYVSMWMGEQTAGRKASPAVDYDEDTGFSLRDAATGKVVFTGTLDLDEPVEDPTDYDHNFNQTDIFRADFSEFDDPGTYVLQVEGVGTSFAFDIADDVWVEAFETSMLGFYNQRSGIELTEPYTSVERPRDLHPDDGFVFKQSEATLMDTSMGLNLGRESSFTALAKDATSNEVDDAWGGWHDAGDWDRRIQQLFAARDLLDVAELTPEFAEELELAIPEASNRLPDVIDEALWSIDFYKRIQKSDGGVPGGIESEDHPQRGETSWTESLDLFVYAPDAWSSYIYAGVAAKAATLIEPYDRALADDYLDSAVRAMNWAEKNTPAYAADEAELINEQNLAAAELYRATGENRWHKIFVESSSYASDGKIAWNEHQHDATLVYANTDRPKNAELLQRGLDDLLFFADRLISEGDRGGFGQIVNPRTPYGFGYTSAVPADAADILVKAHALTGEDAYFEAILRDTLFGLGANPDNLVITTGLGERNPQEPLIVDAAGLGEIPDGISLFGGWNVADRGYHWSFGALSDEMFPAFPNDWPVHETYVGYTKSVPIVEYAMHTTMGPVATVWGYLAGADADGTDRNPPVAGNPKPNPGGPGDQGDEGDGPIGKGIIVRGTDGEDTLIGTDGGDTLHGEGGNDVLIGGPGPDIHHGGPGWDTIEGTLEDLDGDFISEINTDRILVRNAEFDEEALSTNQDGGVLELLIDADHDGTTDATIRLGGESGGRFDTTFVGTGDTAIVYIPEQDQPSEPEQPPEQPEQPDEPEEPNTPGDGTVLGTEGADRLEGSNGGDTLVGLGGNDVLLGGAGPDVLDGGRGWDSYEGSLADLNGDRIVDLRTDRILIRDAAFDETAVGNGVVNEAMMLTVDIDGDGVAESAIELDGLSGGGFRTKAIWGGHTAITHDPNASANGPLATIELPPSGSLGQVITGTGGADRLEGTPGEDTLGGEAGNDVLLGRLGRDVLDGGKGWDNYEGTLAELDGDTIAAIERDRVFVRDADFGDEALGTAAIEGGVALTVDLEGDDIAEAVMVFEGIEGGGFYTQSIWGGHTAVRYDPNGESNGPLAMENLLTASGEISVEPAGIELSGTNGADRLVGGDGGDSLSGGLGNDVLLGGLGSDRLEGGRGWDNYEGTLAELDGDTIVDIRGDRIVVRDGPFGQQALQVENKGDALELMIDVDNDGITDASLTFEGVSTGSFKAHELWGGRTALTYDAASTDGGSAGRPQAAFSAGEALAFDALLEPAVQLPGLAPGETPPDRVDGLVTGGSDLADLVLDTVITM
ncbi:MAG: glycoside hydrolase family 9 protein [Geminicoccaceae bacterium]